MSKVIAFILGMVFGLLVVLGAVAACIFVVTPDMVTNNQAGNYMGDFSKESLFGMYNKITQMYKDSVGNFYRYKTDADGNFLLDENGRKQIEQCTESEGQLLTLGMFCATTGIDLDKIVNMQLPASVYDVPMLEYFNGSDGINKALKQIKVSTIPDIVNLFAKTDENGNKIVSNEAIAKLGDYSIYDLMDSEKGVTTVFGDVLLTDLLPKVFPSEQSDDNQLMYALGLTSIGGLYGSLKQGNIFAQLKEGGALEEVGNLPLTTFFADNSTLADIFGDTKISALIDDNGKITADEIMTNLKVGNLLGYTYEEETSKWYKTDDEGNKQYADGAIAAIADLTLNDAIKSDKFLEIKLGDILGYTRFEVDNVDDYNAVGTLENVRISTDGKYALADGDVWYEASLVCSDEHEHTADCFAYDWYAKCTDETEEHTHADERQEGDTYYKLQTGLFANLADLTVGDLVKGGTDKLMNAVKQTKLGELGITLPDMLKNFADLTIDELMKDDVFDNMYIGELLGYELNIVEDTTLYDQKLTDTVMAYMDGEQNYHYIKAHDEDWAEATLTCADETAEHIHTADCFAYVWYKACAEESDEHTHDDELNIDGKYYVKVDGLYGMLADFTIGQLTKGDNITDKLMDIKLNAIIDQKTLDGNPLLKNFADKTIRQLTDKETINGLYLGQVFEGFERDDVSGAALDNYTEVVYSTDTTQIALVKRNTNGDYIRKNGAKDDVWYKAKFECTDLGNEEHTCDQKCYPFVWYKVVDGERPEQTEGMQVKLASYTIADLNDMEGAVKQMTLQDVLGNDGVPKQFASIADTKIGNLEKAINTLMLGNVMGYNADEKEFDETLYSPLDFDNVPSEILFKNNNDRSIVKKIGEKYFVAKCICNHSSNHTEKCYFVAWQNGESDVDGIMAKLAEKQISELGNMQESINEMTLSDVMGNNVPSVLKNLADTQIGELGEAIDNMYVGEMLDGYYLNGAAKPDDTANVIEIVNGTGENARTLLYVFDNGNNVSVSKDKETWSEGVRYCDTADETHVHDYKCFGFKWYTDEPCENVATGAMARIANVPLNQLSNANDVIDELTLADVMGKDKVPEMLKKLSGTKIGDLGNEINNLYVGDVLGASAEEVDVKGYTGEVDNAVKYNTIDSTTTYAKLLDGKWYLAEQTCSDTEHTHTADCFRIVWTKDDGTKLDGISANIADMKINELSNNDQLNSRIQNMKLGDVMTIREDDTLMQALKDCKISDIGTEVKNLKLEDVIDIDENSPKILQALKEKGTTVSGLGNTINDLQLQDVIDTSANPILDSLKESNINNLATDLNSVPMGVAMGYTHVNTDEEGAETCTTEGHSSTAHWHEKDSESNITEVKGIYAKVADKTINDMSNGGMKDIMNELTLGEVVDTTNENTNPILKELSTTKVNELGTALNNMSMGVAMGYTHVNTGEEGAETCSIEGHATTAHWHDADGNEVKGIYAKIANKNLSNMSSGGMNGIMEGLTMGDLVDSGIMNLQNDDEYTLAILSGCSDHSFTDTVMGVSKTFECTVEDYLQYRTYQSTTGGITAKDYFAKCHKDVSDAERTKCENNWKDFKVTDFVNAVLEALR